MLVASSYIPRLTTFLPLLISRTAHLSSPNDILISSNIFSSYLILILIPLALIFCFSTAETYIALLSPRRYFLFSFSLSLFKCHVLSSDFLNLAKIFSPSSNVPLDPPLSKWLFSSFFCPLFQHSHSFRCDTCCDICSFIQ